MRMRWLVFFGVILLIEWYAFQAFKTLFDNRWLQRGYLLVSVLILVFIIVTFYNFDRSIGQNRQFLTASGLLLLVYLPKAVIAVFLMGEDILRVFTGIFNFCSGSAGADAQLLPTRRKFLSTIALGAASIPFISVLYGIVQGRFNYKVIKQTVYFDDLPEEFDGMKIMQLSDIHSGSFDHREKIQHGIDLINDQDFDLLVFTGDLVNNFAYEMDDWIEMFSEIKNPKFGKYSVLGNHDYGDYSTWNSEKERNLNFQKIKAIFPKIGFKLLLNESVSLKNEHSEIKLVGIENWGAGRFQKYGDLKKASDSLQPTDFKVLLSHDPSHWEVQVRENAMNYQLTLSGHTHGMQFGIEIPGWIKWSPAEYVYKYWAGLYHTANRYLYVNRGFGFHAYPGRVGIWPEITLLELKKKSNS
ncbi:metallophosphoesterase [Moheibacter lacus]|uniref:Metallophosphoesterase n=1 Tax=Moheibacter lacus TaxID=2745851 RepID=A0A838ZT28_9FLAO|nr:metallophosphoesterase [Moheibacter lacus]MBA5630145.1 metallophosphoesterase [Moheibacter lacus]